MLFLGSRAELLAPIVIILWGYGQRGTLRILHTSLLVVVVLLLFNYVGSNRALQAEPNGFNAITRALLDTSSPYTITARVWEIVPKRADFYMGVTYLDSIKMLLPGPVSRNVFYESAETGSFAFRDLINFHDPNQGFGFSLPSEAYMNFGIAGVVAVSLLVGSLFGLFYKRSRVPVRGRASDYFYAILLSSLPYGLRSDALGQLKMTLYPLLILSLVLLLTRRRERVLLT